MRILKRSDKYEGVDLPKAAASMRCGDMAHIAYTDNGEFGVYPGFDMNAVGWGIVMKDVEPGQPVLLLARSRNPLFWVLMEGGSDD